jgi:hypothetical protein
MSQTCEAVRRIAPYVDRIVIVQNDFEDQDEEIVEEAAGNCPDVRVIQKPWIDHFSAYRNRYLSEVKDGWVLVSDPDEWFSKEAGEQLHDMIKQSRFGSRYNVVAFNSVDTWYADDVDWAHPDPKKILASNRAGSWFKQLFFKYYPGLRYDGVVHEGLHWPDTIKVNIINASPECYYEHVKTNAEVRERGTRNFFTGGAGVNDLGKVFPEWAVLRKRLTLELGISTWYQFRDYLKAGNIQPWLKQWIIDFRNWNKADWMGSEIRGVFYWYFKRLHSEEQMLNPETGKFYESDFPE